MDTPIKKKKPWLRFIELPLILVFVAYIVPAAKHALFPDQMTRVEKMLRRSTMAGCHLAVDRQSKTKIILTVFNGSRSITSEIYKTGLHELEPSGDTRTFFTYSVNRDSNEVFYLTRTRIEADADLKRVRRLEVGVCGRLVDQHAGVTRHEGYKPVYACEVPEREAVCLAADSATGSK
jgi:hypothetical protein